MTDRGIDPIEKVDDGDQLGSSFWLNVTGQQMSSWRDSRGRICYRLGPISLWGTRDQLESIRDHMTRTLDRYDYQDAF